MSDNRAISKLVERTILIVTLLLFAAISVIGITWGLPSPKIDKYLFGGDPPWTGEKIYRLAGGADKFSPDRGADVDADPIAKTGDAPILLTGTDGDVAKIYLRYRLYTYQPDEMITMMALAGMSPRGLDLDPRLYQYGGLFIYPVGALIGACGFLGLIDVRSDVTFYLDNPDEFGKFYVVARAYSAAWGLVGVLVVFAIARRLGGACEHADHAHARATLGHGTRSRRDTHAALVDKPPVAPGPAPWHGAQKPTQSAIRNPQSPIPDRPPGAPGLVAALLFTLMPVVICMAHEGKPHLPGSILMLLAVLFAMRHLDPHGQRPGVSRFPGRDFWLMCICCGAAFGMVLSSLPIFVLIPLVVLLDMRREAGGVAGTPHRALIHMVGGIAVGAFVYLVTNPYVVINAIANRDVLRSNFGNSLAMYDIARIGEGLIRVMELTVEGTTLPILVLGVLALILAAWRAWRMRATVFRCETTETADFDRGTSADDHHARAALGHGTQAGGDTQNTLVDKPPVAPGAAPGHGTEHPQQSPIRNRQSAIPERPPAAPGIALILVLAVPAAVFFMQFVLIGAGKPAEYGRFGIFTNAALAIGTACLLGGCRNGFRKILGFALGSIVVIWTGFFGATYVHNFHVDTTGRCSRVALTSLASSGFRDSGGDRQPLTLAVLADPAPYSLPPVDFSSTNILLFRSRTHFEDAAGQPDALLVVPVDRPIPPTESSAVDKRHAGTGSSGPGEAVQPSPASWLDRLWHRATPISWANKPFHIEAR